MPFCRHGATRCNLRRHGATRHKLCRHGATRHNTVMRRRSRKGLRLDHVIGRATTPVYLVAPDRRITFFNSGCQTLTGFSADEVVGQRCEFVTDLQGNSAESLAAALCPPAAAFEGRVASLVTQIVRKEGDREPRTLN